MREGDELEEDGEAAIGKGRSHAFPFHIIIKLIRFVQFDLKIENNSRFSQSSYHTWISIFENVL